jgi:hypothetical protein
MNQMIRRSNNPIVTNYMGFEMHRTRFFAEVDYQLPLPRPINFLLNSSILAIKALTIMILVIIRVVSIALMVELPPFLQFLSFDSLYAYYQIAVSVASLTHLLAIFGAQDNSYEQFMITLITVLCSFGYLVVAAIYRTAHLNELNTTLRSVWEEPARTSHHLTVNTGVALTLRLNRLDFAIASTRHIVRCIYCSMPRLPLLYAPYVLIFVMLHVLMHISDLLQYMIDPQSVIYIENPQEALNHANNNIIDPVIELQEIRIQEASNQQEYSIPDQPNIEHIQVGRREHEVPLPLESPHSLDEIVVGT